MSYWRIPLLLLVLLAAGAGVVACGGGEDDPLEMLESAGFAGVTSGRFEASLSVQSQGKAATDLDVELSGQVQSAGGNVPQFAVDTEVSGSVRGKQVDFSGGLTILSDHAFLNYQGTDYEIEPNNFTFAKSLFLRDDSEVEGTTGGIAACRRAAAGIGGNLFVNPREQGTVDIDGTATTKISGEIDVKAAVEAVSELARDPDCRAQMEAVIPLPLPELRRDADQFAADVERSRFEVYIDDEGVIRKLVAELTGAPQATGGEAAKVDLEFVFSEVNQPQEIAVPANAKPLGTWFSKLGINQFQFITLGSGGEVVAYLLEKISADALP